MDIKLRVRSSQLSKIMGNAKSIDPALMTPELEEIKAKRKRLDWEQALLDDALAKTLSEGAKTYLKDLAKQDVYGYRELFSSRQTEKGKIVEDDSIVLFNGLMLESAIKNTERRTDLYLTGEPDIVLDHMGYDIKSSWTVATFPAFEEDAHNSDYEWQCRAYMRLFDKPKWGVAFCLVDTPDHLIQYDPVELHQVSHIPAQLRMTTVVYERCLKIESQIVDKVQMAQVYFANAVNEILRQHGV